MSLDPILHVRFDVVAYDESVGGYGDNRSREFTDGDEAVAYAKSLSANFGAQVFKRITMDPISLKIYPTAATETPEEQCGGVNDPLCMEARVGQHDHA